MSYKSILPAIALLWCACLSPAATITTAPIWVSGYISVQTTFCNIGPICGGTIAETNIGGTGASFDFRTTNRNGTLNKVIHRNTHQNQAIEGLQLLSSYRALVPPGFDGAATELFYDINIESSPGLFTGQITAFENSGNIVIFPIMGISSYSFSRDVSPTVIYETTVYTISTPEPATFALCGLAVVASMLHRKKHRIRTDASRAQRLPPSAA